MLVSRTALDIKTSEFVFAHLRLDGVQCIHKGLYWFRQRFPYIQWILLLLVLPCIGVLVVGVMSEGVDPKSLWWRMSLSSWSVTCVLKQGSILIGVPLDVAPASPFIVPKGRAHVTFVVKKRNGEKTKEKNKRWPRVRPSSSLSGMSILPCSTET
jgi:hypothetical protein